MLTMNQRDTTLQCLSSLMENKDMGFNVVLWDNGSEDGTAKAVADAFPSVLTHYHPGNLGVASGRNAAAKLALETFSPTHLLFLDNDMLVEPGFAAALFEPFTADDQVGQTQAKLRFMYDRKRLNDGGGCNINFLLGRTRPVGYGEIDRGQYDEVKPCVACGGAMMVRADLFQRLGGFDSSFDPFGPEDLDFSLRLQKAGYTVLYVPGAMAYHAVSHSFGKGYNSIYARNKTRHWFLLLKRHAPFWKKVVFMSVTAPVLFIKVLLREAAKGNPSAFKGLFKGLWDVVTINFGKQKQ